MPTVLESQRRNRQYARKCKRCKQGYDPNRSVVHGQVFWLHDYVIPCGAGELREKQYQETHKEPSK